MTPETIEQLQATYPLTVAAFTAMAALPALQSIADLERRWQAIEEGTAVPALHQQVRTLPPGGEWWDLAYAGGGLGLLHALVMQRRYGYRVVVFDRGRVGQAHREWNISTQELQELVRLGIFTDD